MSRLTFTPRALVDFETATRWYQRRSPDVATRFRKAVHDCVKRIAAAPRLWPQTEEGTRRAAVQRFPYGVYYVENGGRIYIAAIMHHRRHPGAWSSGFGQRFDGTDDA